MRTGWQCLGMVLVLGTAPAVEEQSHGVVFEREVRRRLTGSVESAGYTAAWDIPGDRNRIDPGLPVSVKCTAWGNAVYLGDALRQRGIDHPFGMVVGFYREQADDVRLVALHYVKVDPPRWRKWWGEVTDGELEVFAAAIKGTPLAEAQALGRARAAELRARGGIIGVHPKINADQRRIQCAIPFREFFREVLGCEPVEQPSLVLAGEPFPDRLPKGSRLKE